MNWLLFSLYTIVCISPLGTHQLLTDPNEAQTIAQQESKQILMIFSGSDWCKPCIQFDKEIIQTESFEAYAADQLILLNHDFPYSKKNKLSAEQQKINEQMAERYNPKGIFPYVLLLTENLQPISTIKYKSGMSSEEVINQINAAL